MAAFRRAEQARARKRPEPGDRHDLILLDTAKIRSTALKSYRKAERELAKVTDQLKRYHEHDVPGFRAWCSRTFGALLTELREQGLAFQGKQKLASEIAELAFRENLSEVAAYRELLWRRANPEAAADKDRSREEAERRRREAEEKRRLERGEPEDDRIFDPFGEGFDDEDDDFDDDEDEDFEEFINSMFGGPRRKANPPKSPKSDNKTAKELYRTIVRNLHPDHHGHMSEARKHLWNEAQQAYRAGDVETLQTVLAQCESGEAGLGDHSPVSVILNLTRRLKAAMRPVRSQIRQVNRRPEWNFSKKIDDPRYVRNVEQSIREDLRHLKREFDEITRVLNAVEQEATRKNKRKGRSRQPGSFFPGFGFKDEDSFPF